ncbi:MAG: DUF3015 family protein [Bdellovibrionota bacterium]
MKTFLKLSGILTFLVTANLITSTAFAGDSGCGLGGVIISKNSKLLQIFSITTNASFFSQAFGITSGTSGCSASGIVSNDKQIEYFVEVNHDDLTREMAQGSGEKLQTLAVLNGCKTAEAQMMFSQMTQAGFKTIVPKAETTPEEIVVHVRNQMQATPDLMKMCEAQTVSSL